MPITIRYMNDDTQECAIRPTPLVSINTSYLKNKSGQFGATYNITLTGTILADLGFPVSRDVNGTYFDYDDLSTPAGLVGPYDSFDSTVGHSAVEDASGKIINNGPKRQLVPWNNALESILFKQKVLRALFAMDGQRMEISPVHNDEPSIICYPRVVSIDFSEGVYVDKCDYSITLEADTLLDKNLKMDIEGNPLRLDKDGLLDNNLIEDKYIAASGGFVEDFSDNWSIEADEGVGQTVGGEYIPRTYRITRTMNATGKNHYRPHPTIGGAGVTKIPAWEQARNFVQNRLMYLNDTAIPESGIKGYPNYGIFNRLGSGTLNLIEAYRGFNHTRTETIGMNDGTYSVTENWVLASGESHENYNMSISSDLSAPFIKVSIDGNIMGLSSIPPSGQEFGGIFTGPGFAGSGAYENAVRKYMEISQSGKFGINSSIFKRANNAVAVQLNAQPASVSLGMNEQNGEITYSLDFDNRPVNIISGVLSENISINDTYPGDLFATLQVIGRKTGPVLQYIGGRTEYKRDVSIELLMDYTEIPYGSGRKSLMLQKPSLVEPQRSQINDLITELSPRYEPGIRKYFISPPSESWSPKEGRYSFNISWTYELDR